MISRIGKTVPGSQRQSEKIGDPHSRTEVPLNRLTTIADVEKAIPVCF